MADDSIDYTRAGEYITDYYDKRESMLNEFEKSIRDAITNFFLISTIPEEKAGFPLLSILFDLVWVIAPEVKIVAFGLTKVKDYYKSGVREMFFDEGNKKKLDAVASDLAKKAEEMVKGTISGQVKKIGNDSSKDDNANKFTSKAIDEAAQIRRALIAMLWYEREVMRRSKDLMYDNKPEKRGKLKATFETLLGPPTLFDTAAFEEFGKNYEVNLYKKFYEKKGKFKYFTYQPFYNSPYKTVITVENIPKEVVNRIKEIKKAATEELAFRDWTMEKVYKRQRETDTLVGGTKF